MRGDRFLILILAGITAVVAILVFNDDGMVGQISEGRFAEGAYMGIWALVLASSLVLVFRTNIGGAVKYAALWAAAFLVLVGLYAYRGEFREIGDRIMAELVPGRAIAVADSDGRQVMVMRTDDSHFHVAATVNGESVDFLVDTGASVVALDRAAAEAIGIDVGSLAFTDRVMTANGIAASAPVTLASIKIGEIERENVPAAVMDRESDGTSLLGMSFLGTLSGVEFRGERLTLKD